MKKIITCCALLACACCAHAYELVATVSTEEETRWHLDIELADNDIDFAAFQLDITLDGDAKLERKNLKSGPLMHQHTLMLATPQEHYRIVGYNLSGTTFMGKEGLLFSFSIDGDVKGIVIDRFFFIKSDGTKFEAAPGEDAEGQDAVEVTYDMKDKQSYRIDRRGISIRKES